MRAKHLVRDQRRLMGRGSEMIGRSDYRVDCVTQGNVRSWRVYFTPPGQGLKMELVYKGRGSRRDVDLVIEADMEKRNASNREPGGPEIGTDTQEIARLRDLLREVRDSGVSYCSARYREVQISDVLWAEIAPFVERGSDGQAKPI